MNNLPALLLAIVGLLCLTAMQCQNDEETKKFRENRRMYRKLKCGVPQPRAFSLKEIDYSKWKEWQGKEVCPPATVLYRCESSGCCPENMRCEAILPEPVTLYFSVGVVSDRTYNTVNATNHTSCECVTRKTQSNEFIY